MEMTRLLEDYGCLTFSDDVMKERIPKSIYKAFHESLDNGEELSKECATVIANAMKIWALENGATHFTHWFMPMTGLTAEKHDAFLEPDGCKAVLEFSGKVNLMHRLSRLEDYGQHLKREAILHGIVHHRHLLKMDLYIFQLCFVHILEKH